MITGKTSVKNGIHYHLLLSLKGMAYIAVQMIASIIATYLTLILYPTNAFGIKSLPESLVVDLKGSPYYSGFVVELVLTFILVYIIFATAFDTGTFAI